MKLLQDFSTPEYFAALTTSIKNGLGITILLFVAGMVLTSLGGGFAARNKKEASAHHH